MMSEPEIPREPLQVSHNYSGSLPPVGLHRKGALYFQESSYSDIWLSGGMLVAAVVVALLPWHTKASPGGDLKYYVSGMLVWGAVCSFVPYFIRNACGLSVAVNPEAKMLSIMSGGSNVKLSWNQIAGLQICRRKVPGNSEMNGYQLNLVWLAPDGAVTRCCLLQHSAKGFVVRLGKRYESLFGFALMDHTCNSQPGGVAKPG